MTLIKEIRLPTLKNLTCCCCGRGTKGRQWWNRCSGFGICSNCAILINKKEEREYMEECFGEEGVHYFLDN